jgi:hypothetical protein
MKSGEQILSIRRQRLIKLSREGLWFLNENSNVNLLHSANSSFGSNRLSNRHEIYIRNSLESYERNSDKTLFSFIVDWQLPDIF